MSLWGFAVLQMWIGYILSLVYQFLKCTSSLKSIQKCCGCSKCARPQIHLLSVDQCQLAGGKMFISCMHMSWGVAVAFAHSFLFPLFHSPLTFACTCQCCCPKTALTQSGWTEAGLLSESIPESAARPLPESCDSHSSSFPLPRGQASSSSVKRNDPSVWHAQNPESPYFGVWVQIPPPGGRAGTPANDSEMQRVSALVSWSTEALCELSCTFFP